MREKLVQNISDRGNSRHCCRCKPRISIKQISHFKGQILDCAIAALGGVSDLITLENILTQTTANITEDMLCSSVENVAQTISVILKVINLKLWNKKNS